MTRTVEESSLREGAFEDMETRAVYCDWLEEQGEQDNANFWRWALEQKLIVNEWEPARSNIKIYGWATYQINANTTGMIPNEIYDQLKDSLQQNDEFKEYYNFKDYPSKEQAWTALEQAWLESKANGKFHPVTKEEAMNCHTFYHYKLKNADGTAIRCRANGKCKTWKTRPEEFELPVKYGLRECFYITQETCVDWSTIEPKN